VAHTTTASSEFADENGLLSFTAAEKNTPVTLYLKIISTKIIVLIM